MDIIGRILRFLLPVTKFLVFAAAIGLTGVMHSSPNVEPGTKKRKTAVVSAQTSEIKLATDSTDSAESADVEEPTVPEDSVESEEAADPEDTSDTVENLQAMQDKTSESIHSNDDEDEGRPSKIYALKTRKSHNGLSLDKAHEKIVANDHHRIASEMKQIVDSVTGNLGKKKAKIGVIVRRLDTNEVLYEHDADELINPASNIKLITSVAAFDILKPEHCFTTDFYHDGTLKDGILHGNLYVKGYGDPSIDSERMQKIGRELYLRGVTDIKGDIIYDEGFFDDNMFPKGYSEESKKQRAYAAPIHALSFNHNTISLFVGTGEGKSRLQLDPPVSYAKLVWPVNSAGQDKGGVMTISKDDKTYVQVQKSISKTKYSYRVYRSIYDPGKYFASGLEYFLDINGVKTLGHIKEGSVPKNAKRIFISRSPPLARIIKEMNLYSSNFLAENMVKSIGATVEVPATFDNGLNLIRQFLENKVGFKKGSYVLNNGSGLNYVNLFSARQIVNLLTYAYNDFEISPEFVSSLSVAGTQGTMAKRLRQTKAKRRLRAKTGTLTGVSALSGYVVTKTGVVLAFSILVSGHHVPTYIGWNLQDRLGKLLAVSTLPDEVS